MSSFNDYVSIYKEQIDKGDIVIAYGGLVKFVTKLKSDFSKSLGDKFKFGSIFQGYMDYTYFYFTNDFLNDQKLRFGLVLNHDKMRFEIWLLGRNDEIQNIFWEKLKSSKWNKNRKLRPQYSVLETTILENLNFDDLDRMRLSIEKELVQVTDEITVYLRDNIALLTENS